ncbi:MULTISPECIES: type II toxin-antitoxin system VapC family toxin [unclassified Sphingomonas]|uniref:type II toxin-antitoxin system VapC family toxin n=1 Tax=unclassified Sphingomonas TaxID=196159 RepID=UPI000303E1FE|nr:MULTISPECIES: type II toxin-antitoxin system VapC family toxin [unclassified Sphingomonas]KTF67875.1 transcriptional regulator [Sphingomonas sp. WG]
MSGARYMLDTNIVSDLVRNPQGRVFDRILRLGSDQICISVITAAELRYGCAKKGSPKLLAQVEAILDAIDILPFDVPADTEYGGIRAELEAAGKPIGPNDLMIAAHAYSVDATLVTANIGEFQRVRGLKVENWIG